jgi:hypothetical protein
MDYARIPAETAALDQRTIVEFLKYLSDARYSRSPQLTHWKETVHECV